MLCRTISPSSHSDSPGLLIETPLRALSDNLDTPATLYVSLSPGGVVGISTDPSYIMVEAKDIVPEMQSTIAHALSANAVGKAKRVPPTGE